MREVLTMIVGRVEDFTALGIELGTNRKSLDGTQVLIHREHLSSVDLNLVLMGANQHKMAFFFIGDTAMEEMLSNSDWSKSDQ